MKLLALRCPDCQEKGEWWGCLLVVKGKPQIPWHLEDLSCDFCSLTTCWVEETVSNYQMTGIKVPVMEIRCPACRQRAIIRGLSERRN
jgi:hypothetical protein